MQYSPFVGKDLLAILCVTVWPYEHLYGDQRHKGYGRFMLHHIEQYARFSGFKGVVTWAMDWDWNPASFYERSGYSRVDVEDKVVVLWKKFHEDAEPPRLLRLEHVPSEDSKKIRVVVADNPWCDNNMKLMKVREAIEGIENLVDYAEVGPPQCNRMIHLGYVGGVYLDGKVYRPYEFLDSAEDLREEIVRLYELKQQD